MEYFRIEGVVGKLYFRCEPYLATLSTEACADMWRKGNREGDEDRIRCLRCPLGAKHAGERDASMSVLKSTLICGRCHRNASRLVYKHLCVSCYNREREILIGRNAKGSKPTRLKPLERRRLKYTEGDKVKTLELERSASVDELIVALLRDSDKHVRIGFSAEVPALDQLRLW